MKITVYYEDNRDRTTIEVPDVDCELWVETDYQKRLETAEDKTSVLRRTPQQIMDDECNKPTYNSHHKETRRHVSLDAFDPMGDTLAADSDMPSCEDEDYSDLYRAIEKLRPQQKELIRKVFWDDMRQIDIARDEGVSGNVVDVRMHRAIDRLRKMLKAEKKDSKKP